MTPSMIVEPGVQYRLYLWKDGRDCLDSITACMYGVQSMTRKEILRERSEVDAFAWLI